MPTWAEISGFKGYYISQEIPLSIEGDGAESKVNFVSTVPDDTSLILQSSCSFDNGETWSEFENCYQGGSIPQIDSGTQLNRLKIKFRAILQTYDPLLTPSLSSISLSFVPVIEYNNVGDLNVKPEIWITKIGNGDVSLINTSNNNEVFKFTGLISGEKVYINNEAEVIESSFGSTTNRYTNFNDNFLDIPIGINIFKIDGDAQIQFRSQFKLLA